jgi:hypothetical protein
MRGVVGLCLALGCGTAWARPCVIEGKAVEPFTVTVAPKGGLALSLRLKGVEAKATVAEADAPATVDVKGGLVFSGVTPTEKLPIKWSKTVDSANGMLRLPAGTGASLAVHTKGRWLEGDLTDDGIRFRGVAFACEGATLDAVSAAGGAAEPEEDAWIAKDKTVKLRAEASKGPYMEIVMPDATAISWHRVDHAGAMVRVAAKLRDGTYVTGWLKPADLKRPAAAPAGGELGDVPIVQQCGKGPMARPGTQLVTASIDASAPVMYDRLFQWATLKATGSFTVRLGAANQWAELVAVPGISTATDCEGDTALDEAWVPKSAVHLTVPDAGAKK